MAARVLAGLTPNEVQPMVVRYLRAVVRGEYPDMLAAARACRGELRRRYPRRHVPALNTLYRNLRRRARPLRLAHAKARWSEEDARVLRRYAREWVAGRYANGREAARLCQREIESSRDRSRRTVRRNPEGYYTRLRAVARSMGLPYVSRPWTPAERRVLNLHARRLFAGQYRETREAAEACAKALEEVVRTAAHPGARLRPPRSVQCVYAALAHVVARTGLPRFNSPWKRTELEVLERYARATARGKYRSWVEGAAAATVELRKLYAGKESGVRPARLAGHGVAGTEGQIRHLARRLNLGGPCMKRWATEEARILQKWVKRYHDNRKAGEKGRLRESSEGLRRELREAGYSRSAWACRACLEDKHREVYGIHHPNARRWTPEESKIADSWTRWYDRHRVAGRLRPFGAAVEGLQEDLAKIQSERSLYGCQWQLKKRHRRLLGL